MACPREELILNFRDALPAQSQYIQEKTWNSLLRGYMWGQYLALARIQENIFLRNHFPHVCQILGGFISVRVHASACVRTRANTENYSWQFFCVLVSCQGVLSDLNCSGSEKMFPELICETLLLNFKFFRERLCLELIVVPSNFQALFFLEDKLLESVWKLRNPAK